MQLTSWPNDWYTWRINKDEVVDGKTRVADSNDLAVGLRSWRWEPKRRAEPRSDLRTPLGLGRSFHISNVHNLKPCNVRAFT